MITKELYDENIRIMKNDMFGVKDEIGEKMEKEKADLEQLLNRLIEKGFRPFGRYDKLMGSGRCGSRQFVKFGIFPEEEFTFRELTSINSGLWQFVCDNGMIKGIIKIEDYPAPRENKKTPTYKEWTKQQRGEGKQGDCVGAYSIDNYGYRLIESSLKDESELEQFLLENIKVE